MQARRIAVLALTASAAAALARLLYTYSEEVAWLAALALPLVALVRVLFELPLPQGSGAKTSAARPAIEVLNDLVAGLPGTEESLVFKLRELLVRRLAARTGLPVAEAEARAHELVKDELLEKLLRGEARLRSEREVLELLERIDRL